MAGIKEGNEKDFSGCRKDVLFMLNGTIKKMQEWPVILLELVMVSPGTHLVKKTWVPVQNHLDSVKKNNEFY